ncbi:alanine--tRNA ligase [Blattabacterium cuenoti]|uniref:alanine--tRNA ligase n=1 Tax=Blattabacterium cuenoti TaxID=1653831 RepID=UPI00163D1BD2|nr:alanine--tRNA ligase [Blattabacterium cuenoti]
MKYEKIKNIFIDFFKKKKHKIYPSFPICLNDNSSSFFVNSGMNYFKDYFLGYKISNYLRVANIQRCIRVTGKHNDFKQVGYDNYHHTMFEMMGNWSFGDYSRKKAIEWAWELLVNKYGISQNDIYVTIFKGDNKDKLLLDDESLKYWKNFVNKDHILFFGKKDNFWEMGDNGPCGPCTEIHIDLRNNKEKSIISGKNLVNQNHPKVIEIWNIVFIEFLRNFDNKLISLETKHVDTGMGLERLCMVLQKKSSSYETDIFYPIINSIKENIIYKNLNLKQKISIQIIADHLRAVIFSIYDGQTPSNKESGYIIRKILRRAIIHAYFYLKIKDPFIYTFSDIIIKKFLPKNINKKKYIIDTIKEEEILFINVIKNGYKKIHHIIEYTKENKEKIVDGNIIFKLHDTYGFPSEISKIFVKKHNLSVDEKTLKKRLLEQKNKSKKYNNINIILSPWIYLNNKNKYDKINNSFIGYNTLNCDIYIIKYRKIFYKLEERNYYELVFNKTPFYPESGGQIGDTGFIKNNYEKIDIINTITVNDDIIHIVNKLPHNINSIFNSFVDKNKRMEIECNHTSTHLLLFTLKKILGDHVKQKGSYINNNYLRFDFSHNEKISYEKLIYIENFVQELIFSSIPIKEKQFSSFKEIKNFISFFDKEKYKNYKKLRVISFGDSHELCIGTHVKNTGSIQIFKILSENSSSYGIRRIKAITYKKAIKYLINSYYKFSNLKKNFNCNNISKMIIHLKDKNKNLEKKISKIFLEKIKNIKDEYKTKIIYLNDIKYICNIYYKEENKNENLFKKIGMDLVKEISNLFMFTGFIKNGKYFIFIFISYNLIKNKEINANEIMKKIVKNKYKTKPLGKNNFSFMIGNNKNEIKYILNDMIKYIKEKFSKKIILN